ncbi:MAG TPA: hypothetical protein VM915_16750, partial [Verrucomicrobiae bacterium]|nr:hypothetical protein [Verrucomicrobiae bacterium]
IGVAMGVGGARAHSINEVQAGIRQAAEHDGPFVLDVLSSEFSSPSVDYALLNPEAASKYGAYGMG